ncbi:MAG TPA: type II secretion system protein GspN, partial [Polyangiales bacterium]
MKERLRALWDNRSSWLPFVAYNSLFWFAFWIFCYFTFPYERVAEQLVDRVAASGKGYSLEIGSLSPYWLSGVELTNVVLRKESLEPAPPPVPGDKTPPPDRSLRVKEVHARVGLVGLLFGSKKLNFDAELESGDIEGSALIDGDAQSVSAKLDKVDLGKLGIIEAMLQIPMQGTLSGDIDLALAQDPKLSQGSVKLTLDKLVVGDGKAKVKVGGLGGLTLDPIEAGDLTLDMDLKDGVGVLNKLSADGKDLKLKGNGDVRLGTPLGTSRLSVLVNVKFTDAYRNKSPRTQAMFGLLDSSGAPQIAAAKTADGAL